MHFGNWTGIVKRIFFSQIISGRCKGAERVKGRERERERERERKREKEREREKESVSVIFRVRVFFTDRS